METILGITAAEGLAAAKAFILQTDKFSGNRTAIQSGQIAGELEALQSAIKKAVTEIEKLRDKAYAEKALEQSDIFNAYLEIVQDEELFCDVERCVKTKLVNLETALMDVCNDYAADMAALDDPYMQARADDFRQIFRIILDMHTGSDNTELTFTEDFILVAREIGPADTAKIDKRFLKGIVVETGSRTSHAAIICRAAGIPMLSGIRYCASNIKTGTPLIVDAVEGRLISAPDSNTQAEYAEKIAALQARVERIKTFKDKPGLTEIGRAHV